MGNGIGTVLGITTVCVSLLLSGCGADDDGSSAGEASPSESSSPAESASVEPPVVLDGALGRCETQPAALERTNIKALTLRDPAVGRLPAFRVGKGRTVAIMLHQTSGDGYCGWLPFARVLSEEDGVAVLGYDACNYGESACTKVDDDSFRPADQTDAVQVAIDYARTTMKASRIVVVGASMGGSVALMSAAKLKGIDAAVDISGPSDWEGVEVIDDGKAIRVPVLVAMADDEGEDEVSASEEIVRNAPEGSRFLSAEEGHGYDLLTDLDGEPVDLAEDVIAWVAGR